MHIILEGIHNGDKQIKQLNKLVTFFQNKLIDLHPERVTVYISPTDGAQPCFFVREKLHHTKQSLSKSQSTETLFFFFS